jgi:hypothetical protein
MHTNLKGKKYDCIVSSHCHKNKPFVSRGKNKIYKYPLFNTTANPFAYFSSIPHVNQFDKKVIMSNSGILGAFYDDGKLGVTQDAMYMIVKTEAEGIAIVNALDSFLFRFMVKICKWSNYRNDAALFSYFSYPTVITDVNKFYNISNGEQRFMEDFAI